MGFCFNVDSFWGDLFVDFLIIWCCVLWLVCVCGLSCVLDVVGCGLCNFASFWNFLS